MIEFGKTLREAREAKGLSVAQLADQTHIMHQIVEGLENEDFSRIVAPIYGRGFVKLYCECVGLEPKPYVDEFMDIFNGNRPATIRTRAVPTGTAAAKAIPPAPAKKPVPTPDPAPFGAPAPSEDAFVAAPEPQRPDTDLFGAPVEPPPAPKTPAPSRFAAPPPAEESAPIFRRNFVGEVGKRLPPNTWRILTLALGGLAVIVILCWSGRALYRAATIAPDEKTATAPTTAAATRPVAKPAASPAARPTAKPAEKPASKPDATSAAKPTARKPIPVPALYID